MGDRSNTISKLKTDFGTRSAYIKAKLSTLVPSQIRALRLKSEMPRQADLAREAEMQQSRISMFETPGAANLTLETLSRIAAAFKVGVVVKFVPFSEMLQWENDYSQDDFKVVTLDRDTDFLNPSLKAQRIEAGVSSSWAICHVNGTVTTDVINANREPNYGAALPSGTVDVGLAYSGTAALNCGTITAASTSHPNTHPMGGTELNNWPEATINPLLARFFRSDFLIISDDAQIQGGPSCQISQ